MFQKSNATQGVTSNGVPTRVCATMCETRLSIPQVCRCQRSQQSLHVCTCNWEIMWPECKHNNMVWPSASRSCCIILPLSTLLGWECELTLAFRSSAPRSQNSSEWPLSHEQSGLFPSGVEYNVVRISEQRLASHGVSDWKLGQDINYLNEAL